MNKLPIKVVVNDYHELDIMESNMQIIVPNIKVKEVGISKGRYVGMVYTGNLKDADNLNLLNQLKKNCNS